jgi:hypothetical protein
MILYNVTINLEPSLEQDWLRWMKQEYVPEVMATGLPAENKILRLLTEVGNGGVTYTAQYFFNAMEDFITYEKLHSPTLNAKLHARYGEKLLAFRTLLEEV